MATWPASLPHAPNMDSFSDIPQSTVIRSAMGGLTKQRTRFTAAVHSVSESYVITRAQADTFVAFFRDDLDNGGLEFDKPDFLTGERLFTSSLSRMTSPRLAAICGVCLSLWRSNPNAL